MTNATNYRGFEIISNSDTDWKIQKYTEQADHSLRVEQVGAAPSLEAARLWVDQHLLFHKQLRNPDADNTPTEE